MLHPGYLLGKLMRIMFAFFTFMALFGCATFNKPLKLPESISEYTESKEVLVKKYPDIATYEKQWRGFFVKFPLEENIVKQLGSPKKIKRDWSLYAIIAGGYLVIGANPISWVIALAIIPDTPKTYYFEKERYCIEAKINKSPLTAYKPYMLSWTWEENKDKCKI